MHGHPAGSLGVLQQSCKLSPVRERDVLPVNHPSKAIFVMCMIDNSIGTGKLEAAQHFGSTMFLRAQMHQRQEVRQEKTNA